MKKKKMYNSKTIRISLGDYALLSEISRRGDLTFAEALHLIITNRAKQDQVTVTPRTQIPMPVFQVAAMPAAQVTKPLAPTIRVAPVTTIATNGSKAAAFRIKPRGAVKYD